MVKTKEPLEPFKMLNLVDDITSPKASNNKSNAGVLNTFTPEHIALRGIDFQIKVIH